MPHGVLTRCRVWSTLVVGALGAMSACSGAGPDEEAPLWAAGETPLFELVGTFGSTGERDGEQPLGRVGGIDVDDTGQVYVADEIAKKVFVFLPSGELSRSLGREGEGPGEFKRASSVFVTGRSVWVLERGGAARLTQFDREGEVLGTTAWPFGAKFFDSSQRVGDKLLAKATQISPGAVPEMVVLADDEGPRWDVLARTNELAGADSAASPGGYRVAFRPDGGWVGGWSNAMHLWYYGSDGSVLAEAGLRLPKRVVTEADIEASKEHRREGLAALGVPPDLVEELIQRARYPDTFPTLDQVVLGPDGTVWAGRNPGVLLGEIPAGTARDWYVFDAEGAFLGVAQLPAGFEPHRVVGDLWYGTVTGAYDVESVAAFRVTFPEVESP